MSPYHRADRFVLCALPLIRGPLPLPRRAICRLWRELRAPAPVDALLLLAEQVRAIARDAEAAGATALAARWHTLAALVQREADLGTSCQGETE